jgi:hypothetical protein
MYHQADHPRHNQHDNESRTQARVTARSSSDMASSKHVSTQTAAPVAVRWRKMVAPRPQSHSSSDVDAHLLACHDDHSGQKDDNIMSSAPWLSPTYTTQTPVAVGVARPRQLAATTGIHRRLCFSLDEKALFDLHHPQYSSTTSQQQSSLEQSLQRMSFEPIKPPFAPPERVRTPDGIPSWPGVTETSAYTQQQLSEQTQDWRRKRRGTWSRMKAKFRHQNGRDNNRKSESRRTRIRRALSFHKRPREQPRTFTPWRPPMSGHSTFRFDV